MKGLSKDRYDKTSLVKIALMGIIFLSTVVAVSHMRSWKNFI